MQTLLDGVLDGRFGSRTRCSERDSKFLELGCLEMIELSEGL